MKTNGKPMLDTVLEEVQLLKDESEQVQFLTRLLSKVPFFNPIFPKAVMNDFGEMVNQKIDGIRKQKKNVEALGLRRREQVVVKEDNAQMRGMIAKVAHLVEVTEIAE